MKRRPDGSPPSRVTEAEKFNIRHARLTENLGLTDLCVKFNRGLPAIRAICRGPEFEAMKRKLFEDMSEEARDRLHSRVIEATIHWDEAMRRGARKGDHKPARDLLLATKTIELPRSEPAEVPRQIIINAVPAIVLPGGEQTPRAPLIEATRLVTPDDGS